MRHPGPSGEGRGDLQEKSIGFRLALREGPIPAPPSDDTPAVLRLDCGETRKVALQNLTSQAIDRRSADQHVVSRDVGRKMIDWRHLGDDVYSSRSLDEVNNPEGIHAA